MANSVIMRKQTVVATAVVLVGNWYCSSRVMLLLVAGSGSGSGVAGSCHCSQGDKPVRCWSHTRKGNSQSPDTARNSMSGPDSLPYSPATERTLFGLIRSAVHQKQRQFTLNQIIMLQKKLSTSTHSQLSKSTSLPATVQHSPTQCLGKLTRGVRIFHSRICASASSRVSIEPQSNNAIMTPKNRGKWRCAGSYIDAFLPTT